jgi:Penicillin-Binding Protein C-terminus Family
MAERLPGEIGALLVVGAIESDQVEVWVEAEIGRSPLDDGDGARLRSALTIPRRALGTEPAEACRAHLRIAVDARTGEVASVRTPRSSLQLKTVVDLPPRYAAWAATAGLARLQTAGYRPLSGAENPERRAEKTRLWTAPPENGLHVLRDPETPADQATLALSAVADPPVEQIVWYVDGRACKLVDRPYTARWPLTPGEHVIEARLPKVEGRSGKVRVVVE